MFRAPSLTAAFIALAICASFSSANAQSETESAVPTQEPRPFLQLPGQDSVPRVRSMIALDESNVLFLTPRGEIGIAKFSPGLSLIGWQLYSKEKLNPLGSLALGPNYSVLTASTREINQAFDTDEDGLLDFYQALLRSWPGVDVGVRITAGPVADGDGRILFALSPYSSEGDPVPLARIMAWSPETKALATVTESRLPVGHFALGENGLLAARLLMPEYQEGFYISLTELPASAAAPRDSDPSTPIPQTLPSLLIPAEMTGGTTPTELCFFLEDGVEKLLAICPDSKHLIEIVPEKVREAWQGSILLRARAEKAVSSVVEMAPGQLLAGGSAGFTPIEGEADVFRVKKVSLTDDGIALEFSMEVDRYLAVKPESYSVKSISLKGGKSDLEVIPLVEPLGKTVVLSTDSIEEDTVLRIVCQGVTSAEGIPLMDGTVFFTIHRK